MTRVQLYRTYTIEQLVELSTSLRADPANQTPDGYCENGVYYLYTKVCRRKLDDIGWAITWHLAEQRERKDVNI